MYDAALHLLWGYRAPVLVCRCVDHTKCAIRNFIARMLLKDPVDFMRQGAMATMTSDHGDNSNSDNDSDNDGDSSNDGDSDSDDNCENNGNNDNNGDSDNDADNNNGNSDNNVRDDDGDGDGDSAQDLMIIR